MKLVQKEGSTRGKNPRKITYDVVEVGSADNTPKTLKDFMELTGVTKEPDVLELLIDGFNAAQYAAASDEIGEFINDAWDKDTQAQFRLNVRSYSKLTGATIEDVANMVKPAVEKAFIARQAAKQAQPATA